MHRYSYSPRLICNCPCYCLPDPPSRISAEFISFSPIEFLNCLDKTQIAFLYKVQKQHSPSNVSLGYAYNQSQVCFTQLSSGFLISSFHCLGKLNFFCSRQKRYFAYF